MNEKTLDEVRAAQAKALALLKKIRAVNGIGITRIGNDYGLKVNLTEPLAPGVKLPGAIDGVPIRVEVVGTIRKA